MTAPAVTQARANQTIAPGARELNIGRQEVLDAILALVALPDWFETQASDSAGQGVVIYVTPRFMHEPTNANRAALEARMGAEAVESFIADGQWLGWRLGITAEGDWQFLVKGD
jgi:hypothetical protein